MFISCLIFVSHFLYFAPLPNIYIYFDIPLQLAGLIAFPLYHIYFRLLTKDAKFTLKAHGRYLVFPLIIAILYSFAVLITPQQEYAAWLYDKTSSRLTIHIRFLDITRLLIRITYAVQLVLSIVANHVLIRKYGDKAEQYYSDINDGKNRNAKMLNRSLFVMSLASIIITTLGRTFLMPSDFVIYAGWLVFAVMLFIMGNLGMRLKPINPGFDMVTPNGHIIPPDNTTDISKKVLLDKIRHEFEENKIHLDTELNIMDIVKKLGTNRTYLSAVINQQYNQNFCTFVNGYRIEETRKVLRGNPHVNMQDLAERSGFGSVNSMKRSIQAKTGMTLHDFKIQ